MQILLSRPLSLGNPAGAVDDTLSVQGVQRMIVLVVIFRIFETVVAICYLMHDLKAILAANIIWKSFLKYE